MLASLKGWLGLAGIVAAVLALSGLLGWLKLRRRDMSLVLEASGWALNISMLMNRRIGRVFTFTPALPAGAVIERFDALATREDRALTLKRRLWIALAVLVALAIVYWFFGERLPRPDWLDPFLHHPG